jgi:hypothetical protein
MKKILTGIVLTVFVVAGIAGCGDKGQEMASVNGKKITAGDVQMEIDNLPQEYKMFAQSPEMKRRLLDNLVVAELLVQEAKKEGMLSKPDIQQKIQETAMSIKAEAESKFEALKLEKENADKIATREVVIKNFRENKDFKGVEITDKEIMVSYNQYSAMMKQKDPKAKVEPLDKIKADIVKSLAMQKTVDNLKKTADIKINESAFPAEPPMSMNPNASMNGQPQPGQIKIQEPKKEEKTQVKIK